MQDQDLDQERLELLLQSASLLNSTLSLDGVLSYLLRETLKIVGAQNGCILLVEDDDWVIQTYLPLSEQKPYFSKTILQRVASERETLCLLDASDDESFGPLSSVQNANVRSVLCSPLVWQGSVKGAIYLDHRVSDGVFDVRHERLVEALGQQAAIALENAALHEERERLYDLNLKKATDELADTQAQLFDAHELAAVVTRGLRDPINTVEQQLAQLPMDEATEGPIQSMTQAVAQTRALLDRFWTFIEPDRSKWRNFPLHEVVEQILDVRFSQDDDLELERDLEPVEVFGDSSAIGKVLLSLLDNAEDSLGEGERPKKISVRCRPSSEGALLEVQDTGCGMPPDIAKRIFEPFFSTKGVAYRVGLGLPLAFQTLDRHSAKIQLQSRPGSGSCFKISFPEVQRKPGI